MHTGSTTQSLGIPSSEPSSYKSPETSESIKSDLDSSVPSKNGFGIPRPVTISPEKKLKFDKFENDRALGMPWEKDSGGSATIFEPVLVHSSGKRSPNELGKFEERRPEAVGRLARFTLYKKTTHVNK